MCREEQVPSVVATRREQGRVPCGKTCLTRSTKVANRDSSGLVSGKEEDGKGEAIFCRPHRLPEKKVPDSKPSSVYHTLSTLSMKR